MDTADDSRLLERALLGLDRSAVRAILEGAIGSLGMVGASDDVVAPAFQRIGEGWESGRVALSQVYMSGRIAEETLLELLPTGLVRPGARRVAIGVLGDSHALGKRLVTSILRCAGHEVHDLGLRLETSDIVEKALAADAEMLLISVLMLNKALRVQAVREELERRGAKLPVFVGGAPFRHDPELWRRVGADGWGRNASDALDLVANSPRRPSCLDR